jgi:membrane-associated protease RseP (regulator of RpoE activity)
VLYALGVIIFALGLLGSIALHEVGHMVPAKRFGVKVTQYMVGFGPTVWSRRKGETEYGVKAIPLGGYIRMIGMIPPRQNGKPSRWPRRLATMVEDFRHASRHDVAPGDEPREFYRLNPWKKLVVMIGGPFMNLVIYVVLTIVLLGTVGIKDPTNRVASVAQCVIAADAKVPDDGSCPAGAPDAPANGTLHPGDVILAVAGTPVSTWPDAVDIIEHSADRQISMTIERDGRQQVVFLTPVENVKYADDQGEKTKRAGFIGVSPAYEYNRVGLAQIPGKINQQIVQGLHALASFPSKIGNLFGTIFEGQKRDMNGAIGVVGLGRIGGEVASSQRIDLLDKVYFLLFLLAGVNLLLFFFNLLPLLPLDGGHVAGAVYEMIKRPIVARRRHTEPAASGQRGPPGRAGRSARVRPLFYADTAQMVPVLYGVAIILIAFTLLVVYADIVKPITIT